MITRTEAKAIADSVISPQRRAEIEEALDASIRAAAQNGAYQVRVNGVTKDFTETELAFARDLLQAPPNLFSTTDFYNDSDHWVSWA